MPIPTYRKFVQVRDRMPAAGHVRPLDNRTMSAFHPSQPVYAGTQNGWNAIESGPSAGTKR